MANLETGSTVEPALDVEPDFSPRTEPKGGLNSREELNPKNEVADRISGPGAASSPISSSLDLATVPGQLTRSAAQGSARKPLTTRG